MARLNIEPEDQPSRTGTGRRAEYVDRVAEAGSPGRPTGRLDVTIHYAKSGRRALEAPSGSKLRGEELNRTFFRVLERLITDFRRAGRPGA